MISRLTGVNCGRKFAAFIPESQTSKTCLIFSSLTPPNFDELNNYLNFLHVSAIMSRIWDFQLTIKKLKMIMSSCRFHILSKVGDSKWFTVNLLKFRKFQNSRQSESELSKLNHGPKIAKWFFCFLTKWWKLWFQNWYQMIDTKFLSNSQWHKKKVQKSASWGKCQLGEVPVGGSASWGKCQLGDKGQLGDKI